ncbi:hypothetical protein [Streptomyces sp. NPDC055992]|uniref:DUF7489 domain-containing protein n=1 Tax=Streptomyces sp. NPDC055992 TaxID=3345673 RepID=UPI0035E10943
MSKSQEMGRDDAWEGIVAHRSRGMLDGSNMYHFLEVRLVGGASVKVRVSRRFWKTVAVGDRIAKQPNADPYKA